jgi:hypothetical protein
MKRLTAILATLFVTLPLGLLAAGPQGQGRGRGGPQAAGPPMQGPAARARAGEGAQKGAPRHRAEAGRPAEAGRGRRNEGAARGSGRGDLSQRLERQPELAERLGRLLPPGTNVHEAAHGFRNLGQFVAAANVSRNLNIPFDDLKARMTGENAVSLGRAIQELRPDMSRDEVRRAVREAERAAREETKAAGREANNSTSEPGQP